MIHTRLFDLIEFESLMTPDDYAADMTKNAEVVREMHDSAILTEEEQSAFAAAVQHHGGTVYAAAMTADFCGDSAMNLPLLYRIADEVEGVEVRVFRQDDQPAIKARLASEGYKRIPVIMFFDADGEEIGRFMERPKAARDRVKEWWTGKPDPAVLVMAGKTDQAEALAKTFIEDMKPWYKDGLWRESAAEWIRILRE